MTPWCEAAAASVEAASEAALEAASEAPFAPDSPLFPAAAVLPSGDLDLLAWGGTTSDD